MEEFLFSSFKQTDGFKSLLFPPNLKVCSNQRSTFTNSTHEFVCCSILGFDFSKHQYCILVREVQMFVVFSGEFSDV